MADSLSASCKDLQDAGLASAKTKTQNAKACQNAWMPCAQNCGAYADKYTENDDWSTFNAASRTCSLMASKSKEMLDASTSSEKASSAGTNCLSSASENSATKKDDKAANDAAAAAAARRRHFAAMRSRSVGRGLRHRPSVRGGVGRDRGFWQQ